MQALTIFLDMAAVAGGVLLIGGALLCLILFAAWIAGGKR